MRAFVFGKKVREFVAEDGGAAGFQNNDRRCGFDFGEKLVHDLEEQTLGTVKHANIIEWTPAAEVSARDGDVEARGFEDFGGSLGGRGKEMVVESVGPEQNAAVELRSTGRPRAAVPT